MITGKPPDGVADIVSSALGAAIELRAKEIVESEITVAKARIEERLRACIGEVACTVSKRFSIQHFRDEILIKVDTTGIGGK